MSALRQPVDIVLGERTFSIRPLTFAQVEEIESAMEAKSSMAQGRGIIAAGLSRDHADVAEEVRRGEFETHAREIAGAMTIILRQGGFLPAGAGEARAAAPNAPIGELSGAG